MATQPYTPTYWSDTEPTFTKKLNVMSNNDQWLFENMPRAKYTAYGITRDSGLKIATGTILYPPFTETVEKTVSFGSFFSTACKPVVIVGGAISTYGRIQPVIYSFDSGVPDYRGFKCRMYTTVPGAIMRKAFYMPWIAVGF